VEAATIEMSLRLDSRVGSVELAPYFNSYGLKPQITRLDFGDVDFMGRGPSGECAVVVERKVINDLIQSMQSRRLSGHQLPGLADGYDVCYLIVEGIWRPGNQDQLEIRNGQWRESPRGGFSYRAIDHYLTSLEQRAGVIYRRTSTPRETVACIVNLFRWWREKAWDEHRSHDMLYAPVSDGRRMSMYVRKPNLVEKVACQLPGVDRKARDIAAKFANVRELALADEATWQSIKGIGVKGAKTIVRAIGGQE
jgi:ERCC4-type nuclease